MIMWICFSVGTLFVLTIVLCAFLFTRSVSYWQAQISDTVTLSQIAFDIIGGVVVPIWCLRVDPIIFRHLSGGAGVLTEVQIFFYAAILMSMTGLILWFILRHFKKASGFFAGILIAGALTSFVLGCAIFPSAMSGLIFFIGVFGFIPFVTSMIFVRNGYRAIHQAPHWDKTFGLTLACGILFALGIPIFLQWQIPAMITSSVEQVIYAEDEVVVTQSGQTLNRFFDWLPIFTDWQTVQIWRTHANLTEDIVQGKLSTNRLKYLSRCSRCFDGLISTYRSEKNHDKKAHLAKIYHEATGGNITDRFWPPE